LLVPPAPESVLPVDLLLLMPVVVLDFLDDIFFFFILVAAGAALLSVDAPAAGAVVCAEAMVVAPTNEAATRTASASLDRMDCSPWLRVCAIQNLRRRDCVPADASRISLNIGNQILAGRSQRIIGRTG
jgi:hypothetical protein